MMPQRPLVIKVFTKTTNPLTKQCLVNQRFVDCLVSIGIIDSTFVLNPQGFHQGFIAVPKKVSRNCKNFRP